MITRTDLLNHLATKYNLKKYLEIGVQNPNQNFDKINCEYKVSVDPDPNAHASFCMTSDKFFSLTTDDLHDYGWASHFKIKGTDSSYWSNFDLIFIDGLHTAEQVKKDFENALNIISHNGFIVLHDCNPLKEEHTIVPREKPTGHWNGDVYRFAVTIHNKITVDIDNGISLFSPNCNVLYVTYPETKDISWEYFDKNRKELLNLITWDEFIASHSHL